MGSIITLGLGPLEVDWGKNNRFINHSRLFQKTDISTQVYEYANDVRNSKSAFVRPLRKIVKRLDLLGYTLPTCRAAFQSLLNEFLEMGGSGPVDFDSFLKALISVDVEKVTPSKESNDFDFGYFATEAILQDPEFIKVNPNFADFTRYDGEFFENLDPYVILRLLAENPNNLNLNVIWYFADVVEGGWVDEATLYEGISDSDRILIVTEGSSDSSILKASLPIVYPDIIDFFDFIDMTENYPFTGTGNLLRFCQGLSTIRIQNKVLIVLDNDAAGLEAHQRISHLNLPNTMKVALLPMLAELDNFKTIGPSGVTYENINGRAVAIECFLDFTFGPKGDPAVRWTSYNPNTDTYQGELIDKKVYTLAFFKQLSNISTYNLDKLKILWHHLLSAAVA